MIGLGTIVNCGTVLAGASIGMLLKNGLSKRFEETIMQGIGLCTMFIGIGGAATTKVVDFRRKRMKSSFNAKDLVTYLRDIDIYIEKRRALLDEAYGNPS